VGQEKGGSKPVEALVHGEVHWLLLRPINRRRRTLCFVHGHRRASAAGQRVGSRQHHQDVDFRLLQILAPVAVWVDGQGLDLLGQKGVPRQDQVMTVLALASV
jgi:hypothetical protein